MLDGTIQMFANYKLMLKKIKTKTYEERFAKFMEDNKSNLDAMLVYVRGRQDKDVAVNEVANIVAENLYSEYGKWGHLFGGVKADLSLYMVYFIFPAILKTEDENATLLCDAIRDEWRVRTGNSVYDYTTYDELHGTFQEKLFGVF